MAIPTAAVPIAPVHRRPQGQLRPEAIAPAVRQVPAPIAVRPALPRPLAAASEAHLPQAQTARHLLPLRREATIPAHPHPTPEVPHLTIAAQRPDPLAAAMGAALHTAVAPPVPVAVPLAVAAPTDDKPIVTRERS